MTTDASELTYLDHAATSWPKATGVSAAVAAQVEAGNAGRGGHGPAREASAVVDHARARLAGLLGEDEPKRMVFTAGCTDSIHLAIHGVIEACTREGSEGAPEIVLSGIEHNAVSRTAIALERAGRARVNIVPVAKSIRIDPEAVLAGCSDRTRLVCIVHASNVTGVIQPIDEIAGMLRDRCPEALLLVDAAQTVGVLPIDVGGLGADLRAFGAHKGLRGPSGVGGLWIGPRAWSDGPRVRRIRPVRCGGTGTASEGDAMPDALPLAFEAGSANTAGIAGLGAAVDAHDPQAIQRLRSLSAELLERLHGRFGDAIEVYAHERGSCFEYALPTLALNFQGWDAGDLAQILDASFGIAVRAGLHCSPRCHEALGTLDRGGALRVSLGGSTTAQDIERLLDALGQILGA